MHLTVFKSMFSSGIWSLYSRKTLPITKIPERAESFNTLKIYIKISRKTQVVCAYHPAVPGSNPKLTNYTFSIYSQTLC